MVTVWKLAVVLSFGWHSLAFAQSAEPTGIAAGQRVTSAAAADEAAKRQFIQGKAAYEAGRFAEALVLFARSHAISGRVELLYNVALAADRLQKPRMALDAYERYHAQAPQGVNCARAKERIAALRAALGRSEPLVPTPAEAAKAHVGTEVVTAPNAVGADHASPRARRPLASRWWFWVAIGVVAAGAVTAGMLVGP